MAERTRGRMTHSSTRERLTPHRHTRGRGRAFNARAYTRARDNARPCGRVCGRVRVGRRVQTRGGEGGSKGGWGCWRMF